MPDTQSFVSDVHAKRKKRRFYFFLALVFGLLYALALGASWLILRSSLFHIQKITITGNEAVATDDILSLLQSRVLRSEPVKALLGFNNILIWPDELGAGDLIFIPSLKSVKIEKSYRERSIAVTVGERKPYGIWCLHPNSAPPASGLRQSESAHPNEIYLATGAECWWFDDEGVIFKRAISAQGSLIVTVNDNSQTGLGLNSKILPNDFISRASSVFRVLQASNLNIKGIRLRDLALQELEVETYDGPKLYFSLRFPADNAQAVIENFAQKSGFGRLQYLDFRVENRVYYK